MGSVFSSIHRNAVDFLEGFAFCGAVSFQFKIDDLFTGFIKVHPLIAHQEAIL